MSAADGLMIAGLILLVLILIAVFISAFVFWILMIIDCAKRKMSDGEQIAWILVLLLLGVLGAAIYYFAVKRK